MVRLVTLTIGEGERILDCMMAVVVMRMLIEMWRKGSCDRCRDGDDAVVATRRAEVGD